MDMCGEDCRVLLVVNLDCRASMLLSKLFRAIIWMPLLCYLHTTKLTFSVVSDTCVHTLVQMGSHAFFHTPRMWLEWSDLNASTICLDAFTPALTAVHLWSHFRRRVFTPGANCALNMTWSYNMCVWCRKAQPYKGGPLEGENEGFGMVSLWGGRGYRGGWCHRSTPQLLKMTPDDLTQRQTHFTMSQQAELKRCETQLIRRKPSRIICKKENTQWILHTRPQPHTLYLRAFT